MPILSISKPLIPSQSIVEGEEEKSYFWDRLMDVWKVPRRHRSSPSFFPSSNPISVSRRNLDLLSSQRYLVTMKSDGIRYLLFLTTRQGSTYDNPLPVALMVDRSRTMYEVEMLAPEDYFLKDTILEGELVWRQPDERMLLFLVFDSIVVQGERMSHRPFEERLRRAEACVRFSEDLHAHIHEEDVHDKVEQANCIVPASYDPSIVMRSKNFVDHIHSDRLWKESSDVEHRVDGLILQAARMGYTFGSALDGSVLKWKDASSVDLQGTSLCTSDGQLPSELAGRRVVVDSSSRIVPNDDEVVEYVVSVTEAEVTLFAIRRRPDKLSANSLFVVERTVQDVVDAVSPSEWSR